MERILVAYDGSAPAKRALDQAAELARAFGASVTIITVVPEHLGLSATVDPFDDETVHARQLEEAKAHLEGLGLTTETIMSRGDPARTIEHVAGDGYDTVVIGSRGRSATSRILLGSVSTHVATHTKGTVLIVH